MKFDIQAVLASNAGVGATLLRVPVGIILVAHGAQKLFGWFGGHGLQGTGQFMAGMGLEPGVVMALLAGSGEFFGGLLLILGLFTRPAALVTGFTMAVALVVAHLGNGFFLSTGGIEYALALLSASAALVFLGGGSASVDARLAPRLTTRSV